MHTRTRTWDAFLTAADHAVLAGTTWAKTRPFGLGRRPALLLVDVYRGAVGRRGADPVQNRAEFPSACGPEAWTAVDNLASLARAARDAGVLVVHVVPLAEEPSPWNRKYRDGGRPARSAEHLDPLPELAPLPGDVVLHKASPSGFPTTALAPLLRARGVDTVVVGGEATSGCVRATVVDAATEGFRVAVVEDGCFDRFEASHWVTLFDLDQKYGDVLTTDELRTHLAGIRS